MRHRRIVCGALAAVVLATPVIAVAQSPFIEASIRDLTQSPSREDLISAMIRLPLATGLAALLALRPRGRGTPPRDLAVIHTQIILAVVGALVMIVVGSSVARAFGIVGTAGLVRYRAKVEDPKDAGVMLATLAIGIATGVGQWMVAAFGAVFFLVLLGVIESFQPAAVRVLEVTVKNEGAFASKARIEKVLRRMKAPYEVISAAPDELGFLVRWPVDRETAPLSEALLALIPNSTIEVTPASKKKAA